MIPRKNKRYAFGEILDNAQCRKCKSELIWCICDTSNSPLVLTAECCNENHQIQFAFNTNFDLKGRYERTGLQSKGKRSKQAQNCLPKLQSGMVADAKQACGTYWTLNSDW
jgi:hypothetical protein